eukprot:8554757-Pyramimonas_sp.AAC.1
MAAWPKARITAMVWERLTIHPPLYLQALATFPTRRQTNCSGSERLHLASITLDRTGRLSTAPVSLPVANMCGLRG